MWRIGETLDKIGKSGNFEEVHFFPVFAPVFIHYRYFVENVFSFMVDQWSCRFYSSIRSIIYQVNHWILSYFLWCFVPLGLVTCARLDDICVPYWLCRFNVIIFWSFIYFEFHNEYFKWIYKWILCVGFRKNRFADIILIGQNTFFF